MMLMRQREMRGPFAIVYNLPEDSTLSTEAQHTKDFEVVSEIVRYTQNDEEPMENKIKGVVRLGRIQEGKHRPVRVQFVGQMYRDIAVRLSFRIRYHNNDIISKTIMSKDLCREDRERAKQKYMEKKQRREAERERASSTAADERNRETPQNIDALDRPGVRAGASTSPPGETQDNVP